MGELLVQRYPLPPGDRLELSLSAGPPQAATLRIERPAQRYRPKERYTVGITLSGGGGWSHLVDAVDALYGQLVESGLDYRQLPVGEDLELGSARFEVTVERARPDLDAAADRLLESN